MIAEMIALSGLLLAGPAPAPAPASVPVDLPAACSDITFIAARGSGDPAAGTDLGMGVPLYGTFRDLAVLAQQSGSTISAIAVDYPAVPIDGSVDAYLTSAKVLLHMEGPFSESVAVGVEAALQEVHDVHTSCPSSRIVLGGLSQGALVVVEALESMPAEDREAIAGVVAFGDPSFNAEDTVANRGGYDHRYSGLLGPHAPWSEIVDAPAFSYCHPADHVCGITAEFDLNVGGLRASFFLRDFAHVAGYTAGVGVGLYEPHSSYQIEATDAAARLGYALNLTETEPAAGTGLERWEAHLVRLKTTLDTPDAPTRHDAGLDNPLLALGSRMRLPQPGADGERSQDRHGSRDPARIRHGAPPGRGRRSRSPGHPTAWPRRIRPLPVHAHAPLTRPPTRRPAPVPRARRAASPARTRRFASSSRRTPSAADSSGHGRCRAHRELHNSYRLSGARSPR
jgi:hypothetical protein